ncbi:hypothetical protein M9Y10_001884 [Tritrichomonas musculus]|uniref:Uncharacterized protein n=1 Tax=Tritrichomonas musculus TaxID=1915356 RepID=A0ABR2L949_9EUKA
MFDNQLEKLSNIRLEITGNNVLLITNNQYATEILKNNKMQLQTKYQVGLYPKKDTVQIKGGSKEIYCNMLNFVFNLHGKTELTLEKFDEILLRSQEEDANNIKKRRSSTTLTPIRNIYPQSCTGAIPLRKLSDLGELPDLIEDEENPQCNSCLYPTNSTGAFVSVHHEEQSKPYEFIPSKSSQANTTPEKQFSQNNSYSTIVRSQPSSPKRDQSQYQSKNFNKNQNQNKYIYTNNKPIERRSTVPNCQEISPNKKYDQRNQMKQNQNQKSNYPKNNKKQSKGNSSRYNNSFNNNNNNVSISFYSSDNQKHLKSDESSDSICTEPDTNYDVSSGYRYSPRSSSPPIASIQSSIASSRSTSAIYNNYQPKPDSNCKVECKLSGNKLIYLLSKSFISNNSQGRSSQQILNEVYEALGFTSRESFNKIIFKC